MDHLECNIDMESRKQEYYRARGAAKRAIFKAKNAERKKFCENVRIWKVRTGSGICSG